MDMDIKIITKESFSVIGKLGQGERNKSTEWIPPLWNDANSHFYEISTYAKLDDSGKIVGIWGAMSDLDERFEPWNDQGKYLAGCEVLDNTVVPNGWTKWVIPSYEYVVAKCSQSTYGEVFSSVLADYFPMNNYKLAGAVHEFYDPTNENGEMCLYFPIKKLTA